MADFVEKYGDDVEAAVELALKDLKVSRDEVVVTVLEEPSRGFLGIFGGKLARVRVEKKSTELKDLVKQAEKKNNKKEKSNKHSDSKSNKAEGKPAKKRAEEIKTTPAKEVFGEAGSEEKSDKADNKEDKADSRANVKKDGNKSYDEPFITKFTITEEDTDAVTANDAKAVEFIGKIAENMGISVEIEAAVKGNVLYINLEGKEVGTLIGKRGQTLDAIQYLASIVQNKTGDVHYRVVVNAEKYREKREDTLRKLAERLSEKCIKTGRNIRLEPMSPYERKVIHSTLHSHPKVSTRSEGSEPNRRVIIELKKKN